MRAILGPLFAFVVAGVVLASSVHTPSIPAHEEPWIATAYCKGTHVAAGYPVKRGMAASDPQVIPLGSIVRVFDTGSAQWDGVYLVVDTGPEIKGREIDLYSWSCYDALDFGRRRVRIEILRDGWMPNRLVNR